MTTDVGAGQGDGAAAAAAGNGGGGIAWLPGVDGDTAKFITDKKVPDLVTLAKNYVEANKTLSTRVFEVPKPEAAEDWGKINAARGVPVAADKYDLGPELKDKVNPETFKLFAPMLHAAGVSNADAAKIITATMGMATQQKEAEHVKFVQASEAAMGKLKEEWGDNYAANYDLASRGTQKLAEALGGLTAEQMAGIEKAIGTRAVHLMGLFIGKHAVEAGFVMADGQQRGMTKEGAATRRQAILNDTESRKALYDGNHAKHDVVLNEWQQLGVIING